jgi:hypothetical protein
MNHSALTHMVALASTFTAQQPTPIPTPTQLRIQQHICTHTHPVPAMTFHQSYVRPPCHPPALELGCLLQVPQVPHNAGQLLLAALWHAQAGCGCFQGRQLLLELLLAGGSVAVGCVGAARISAGVRRCCHGHQVRRQCWTLRDPCLASADKTACSQLWCYCCCSGVCHWCIAQDAN